MKLLLNICTALVYFIFFLFIGKTSFDGWQITMERPVTALLALMAMIAASYNI